MPSISESLAWMEAARQRWSRPGEHWPQGPVSDRSAQPVALADVAPLVRDVEAVEIDPARLRRQLRRLYFSGQTRWPEGRRRGARLDELIAGNNSDAPLSWSLRDGGLTPAVLDALHCAAYLAPSSSVARYAVDTGAVLAGLDICFAGASDLGLVMEYATGVPLDGTAGWVGDLAAWFLEWNRRRAYAEAEGRPWSDADARAQLVAVQEERLPLERILGAMDGRVLAAHLEATVTETLDNAPRVSDTLEAYYGLSIPEAHPHVSLRFPLFVQHALPLLPHAREGSVIMLTADALTQVRAHLTQVATFFLFHGRRDAAFVIAVGVPRVRTAATLEAATAEVQTQGAALDEIAGRFLALLQAGLAGSPIHDWPEAT